MPQNRFGSDMLVLNVFGPAHPEGHSNFVPSFAIVNSPPLPGRVLSSKPLDHMTSARMSGDERSAIKDDVVYNDP